ncbi:MAG: hypothetical protein U0264_11065 [Candidatus Kapaibacterium sp.]
MIDDTMQPDPMDVENNKIMAVLAYLVCLFVVPLFLAKESSYARFHTNQGLVLFIGWTLTYFVQIIAHGFFISFATGGMQLCLLVLALLGVLNASQGKMQRLPIIGNITLIQ